LENESIPTLFIEVQASDKTILDRLEKREQKKGVISDARREDFELLDSGYSSPDEINESQILHVHTDTNLDETIREVYRKIIEHHIG